MRPDDGCALSCKAGIVQADHERLVVSYSAKDDTVYVLSPPGEDPRAVLRAARLVLHDDAYRELARRLGVAPNWPAEIVPGQRRGPARECGTLLPGGPARSDVAERLD